MRIITHLSKYYDLRPIPADVRLSPEDIQTGLAAGLLQPGQDGALRMRITVPVPTYNTTHLAESTIVAKIIHEKTDRSRLRRTLSRKEAVALCLSEHILPKICDVEWVERVEVHDDGPDEGLLRSMLAPHTTAVNPRTQRPNIHPDTVDAHAAAYTEPATPDDHVAHIHSHIGISGKKQVS